jgi:hypothetical protein
MLISSYSAKDWQTAFSLALEELSGQINAEGYEPVPESLEIIKDSYGNSYGWLCSMRYKENEAAC